MADHLQYMETQIITHNDCSRRAAIFAALYPRDVVKPIIHPTSHICTLQPRGIGLCFGDSGSMLVANGQAVGVIVSGVRLCAQANAAPDIYTRVSSYADWIDGYINDLN
ncbi:hypothetical protein PVAND_014524 [Polypedilum vanderplanki]|uniref:Peptidase S1 domain-containing protein n=1 Tax=Polypedilum vanderplanki TaxID=319348 RepID=A0A9J6B9M8_POLVA|nr:hypothetical protein PVAND_014524 [Polypedilum vanderplanki]